MTPWHPHIRSADAGFTLVEALAAMVLMGLVLAALATITGQWLPNWRHGFSRVQRSELLALALDRIVADISAAEFVSPDRDTQQPLFKGSERSVMLVRSTLGPNIRGGLDVVSIGETSDSRGPILVRSRVMFAPGAQRPFGDPVILLRSPYRLSFSYAGQDGVWRSTWLNADALPKAVRLVIHDSTTGRVLPVSTAARIHVQTPSVCVSARSDDQCGNGTDASPAGEPKVSVDSNVSGVHAR